MTCSLIFIMKSFSRPYLEIKPQVLLYWMLVIYEIPKWIFNSLRLRQNCNHFKDSIFKCIYMNEMYVLWFFLKFGWGWECVGCGVGGLSKVVHFNHVGRSFNTFMATIVDVWIIPSFQIWGYVLYVECISCVITNYGQHHWVIPAPLSKALWPYSTGKKIPENDYGWRWPPA